MRARASLFRSPFLHAVAAIVALHGCGTPPVASDGLGGDRATLEGGADTPQSDHPSPLVDVFRPPVDVVLRDVPDLDSAAFDAPTPDARNEDARDAQANDAVLIDSSRADANDSGDASRDADDVVAQDSGDAAGPRCPVPGDYSVSFMGSNLYLRFMMMGTWEGSPDRMQLGMPMAVPLGDWNLTGNTMLLTNDPGAGSGCNPADRGEYTVRFSESCNTMTWSLVRDTCGGRGAVLSSTFTRL